MVQTDAYDSKNKCPLISNIKAVFTECPFGFKFMTNLTLVDLTPNLDITTSASPARREHPQLRRSAAMCAPELTTPFFPFTS